MSIQASGEDGENIVTVGQNWLEVDSCRELVEALHNYSACLFQVRPWDWSGLVLMRVVHEVSYFATVTHDNAQQRTLLEKFIDELLTINRQRLMQEKPPSTYREAKMVAVDVVTNYNGRGGEFCRKTDV